jgi:hypothetical protein
MKYSEYFDRRTNTFLKAFDLIQNRDRNTPYIIVELGTSRSFVNGQYEGCTSPDKKYWEPNNPEKWDWGAGIFTKVFSENLKGENVIIYTIDPNREAISIVQTMCENNNVNIINGYSSDFLIHFNGKIDFLYMDHLESSEEASIQHLYDSEIVIKRDLMTSNGVILVDDVGDNIINTKGKYSIPYLMQNGFKKIIHEYQVLLVKE